MMMKTLSVLAVVVIATYAQPVTQENSDKDIEVAVEDIFGSKTESSTLTQQTQDSDDEVTNDGKCVLEDKIGKCVKYYLCDPDYDKTTKYTGLIIRATSGGNADCKSYLDICCLPEYMLPPPV